MYYNNNERKNAIGAREFKKDAKPLRRCKEKKKNLLCIINNEWYIESVKNISCHNTQ